MRAYCVEKTSIIFIFLLGLTLLSGYILSSTNVSAEYSHIDNVDISVPVACTFSGVGMNSHTATINPGTYNSAIGTTTINVFCNDVNGFAIYAIGYTNDEDGNNTLVSSTSNTIPTGTATSGNSQWAMKLATDSGATYPVELQNGFGSFHTVPDDYIMVARRLSNTDIGSAAVGSSLTTTYQAFISSNQNADTYVGKVKYLMVHPASAAAPTPVVDCNPDASTIAEVECLQDFGKASSSNRAAIIASMTEDQQYVVRDSRDDREYYIAKLADGNVWMTQNLNLFLRNKTFTSDDTDLPSGTTWSPNVTGRSEFTSKTTPQFNSIGTYSGADHEDIGTYYNYTAALAMSDSSSVIGETDQSICPAGWTLPKISSSTNQFYDLLSEYDTLYEGPGGGFLAVGNATEFWNAPTYFILSGSLMHDPETFNYATDMTSPSINQEGIYWSNKTETNDAYALIVIPDNTMISPGLRTVDKSAGATVRCVVRQ